MAIAQGQVPLPTPKLDQRSVCGDESDAHCEQSSVIEYNNPAPGIPEPFPVSRLLTLPVELRQRTFEYVFTGTTSTLMPRKPHTPVRLFGFIGHQYKIRRHGLIDGESTCRNVQAMQICRQLHHETRLLPFQVNLVSAPAGMGSNTTATKEFLDRLKPFQRCAIRKLELHLLASVTEAWSLRSILRSIADDADPVEHRRFISSRCVGRMDNTHTEKQQDTVPMGADAHGSSDLRELTIFITTRDLLLAHAESSIGMQHMLTVPSDLSARPITPFACTASWVTEGLVYLASLRRLTIVIEASAYVASQVTAQEKEDFSKFVELALPSTDVAVQWKVQQNMILSSDESDEWASLLWFGDTIESHNPQGVVNDNQEAETGSKAGWSCWHSVPS